MQTVAQAIPRQIAEQAIRWMIELQADPEDPVRQRACLQWRQSAPEHDRAMLLVERMQQNLASLPKGAARTLLEGPAPSQRRAALKSLAALAVMGSGATLLYRSGQVQRLSADYATAIGERRRVQLDDGTAVHLNTDTAMDVRLDSHHRRIRLLRGEIQIQTGRDPRPMTVDSSAGSLQPLGTRFLVRELEAGIRLGVDEGVVRVVNRSGLRVDVPAGQQLDFDRRVLGAPVALPPGDGAWTDGLLSVSDMPLQDFLAELSRYRMGRLACAPEVADLRISGTFPLDDSDRILSTLPHVLPVQVRQRSRYWVTVTPRQG